MEQKYTLHWKQFLYYCFRIFQLDPKTREQQYGIIFIEEQLCCLLEVDDMMDQVLAESGDVESEEDACGMDDDEGMFTVKVYQDQYGLSR